MPIPKPRKNEKKKDFLDRCMSDDVMKDEYPDNDQRLAVCQSQWDNRDGKLPGLERRVLICPETELRLSDDDQSQMTGYAAKFNKWSEDLGGFREKIAAKAFADVLDDDVRCLKNHDPNLILGRSTSGTLRLSTNTVGLRFEVDVPDTSTGRDTREEIRRGDISGCSFAFSVLEDDWRYKEDGTIERTIVKVAKLFDVGPVTYPAYPDTTVAARSLQEFRQQCGNTVDDAEEIEPEVEPNANVIDAARAKAIDEGYRKAERIINRCRQAEV